MNSKRAIIACFSTILVATAAVVRSDPAPPTFVAEPRTRQMRQLPPVDNRPSFGNQFSGFFSGTRNEAEEKNGDVPTRLPSQELKCLKEIAAKLSITVPNDDSPDNIAFLIKQRLEKTERYRGSVLSEENARDVKSQILEQSDAETFADYHAFIKKIAGKRILILETDE